MLKVHSSYLKSLNFETFICTHIKIILVYKKYNVSTGFVTLTDTFANENIIVYLKIFNNVWVLVN